MRIQRYKPSDYLPGMWPDKNGAYVSHEDHVGSHSFDEDVEKRRHERWFVDSEQHINDFEQSLYGWLACAKSRATR